MLTPTEKKIARDLIRRYCERSEAARNKIHYSQNRPMTHLGDSPENGFTADCSGFATGAFYWADKYTAFKVPDPNGLGYSGYGYTGTLLSHNKSRRVPLDRNFFYVGDMALYGPSFYDTRHVTICRRNGGRNEAIFTSHGREAGPEPTRILYRPDLLIVVRSEALV